MGNPSLKFQKSIKFGFQKYSIKLKPAHISRKYQNILTTKSKFSETFDANVTYKYTCSEDQNISDMGETSRQLFRRIEDHKGSYKNSAIFQHIYSCKTCQSTNIQDNFKVLKRYKLQNLYSLESMVIEEENPILNTQINLNGKRKVLSIY